MATHTYKKTSDGASIGNGSDKTYYSAAFSVPAGHTYTSSAVMSPGTTKISMRGAAYSIWGTVSYGLFKAGGTNLSKVWKNGAGASVKFHNGYGSSYSMRLTFCWKTSDLPTYTVSTAVSPAGSGSLSASPTSAYQGQAVTLSASAGTGYQFSSYSTTGGSISGNTLTMPAGAVTVTANFTKRSYAITVVANDSTMGEVSSGGTYQYQSGIDVAAVAFPGYKFVNWTTTAGTLTSSTKENTRYTVTASAATITANFAVDDSSIRATEVSPGDIAWTTANGSITLNCNMINCS